VGHRVRRLRNTAFDPKHHSSHSPPNDATRPTSTDRLPVTIFSDIAGDQVAIYNELGFAHAVRDVTFHPHEHMVAFCCFSPNMPVLVYKYDKSGQCSRRCFHEIVSSYKTLSRNRRLTDGIN